MIDSLTIFSKTGIILYQHQTNKSTITGANTGSTQPQQQNGSNKASQATVELLNQFIITTLLENNNTSSNRRTVLHPSNTRNSSGSSVAKTGTVAEWEFSSSDNRDQKNNEHSNNNNWVAVAFYSQVLLNRKDMSFVGRFLKSVLKEYTLFYQSYNSSEKDSTGTSGLPFTVGDGDSDQLFDKTLEALWKRAEMMAKRKVTNKDASNSADGGGVDVQTGIARLKLKQQQQHSNSTTSLNSNNSNKQKKSKEKTVWHDGNAKVTKASLAQLDRSKTSDSMKADSIAAAMADDSAALREARASYLPSSSEIPSWLQDEEDWDDEDDADGDNSSSSSSWSFKNLIDHVSGNKVLSDQDLTPPLEEMERMLVSKNVAQDIAREICDGVKANLVGRRMHSFSRVRSTVRSSLENAIAKILSPHRDIDILRQVAAKRDSLLSRTIGGSSSKRPYIIVMVGINGVGKSTSLAKLAYYLKSQGNCRPLLAACDTFRSGAVEQLGVHARCLDVPLFHKGYAKDPSSVAKDAIVKAMEDNNDVVLIDTAGRMQNNLPLMKALKTLIAENQPDLVCFVGEALVGNDGLDQLHMFDKSLSSEYRGGVDGIILSKFDTVGEKVGAALSMAKLSNKPVLFTGVGQKYGHLKKLSVNSVIKSLFN